MAKKENFAPKEEVLVSPTVTKIDKTSLNNKKKNRKICWRFAILCYTIPYKTTPRVKYDKVFAS